MRPFHTSGRLSLVAIVLCSITAAFAAETVPYGHPDYYPSPEQPAQLRGDGSGYFPGSTVVDSFDFRTKENIIWACPLPGWGFSSPIVVGDKAFVTCDWNKLICIDVRKGEVLWAKDNHTFDLVGGDQADRLREMFDQLTIPWLQAHQAIFEKFYVEREIDLIEAARAGKPLEPSKTTRKGKLKERDHWGEYVPGDHLTEAEEAKLLAEAKTVDDATLQKLKDRYKALNQKISEEQWAPQTSGYVGTLNPHLRHSEKEKAYKGSKLPNGMTVSDAMDTLHKHGIVFEIWNGWMGRSFSTPASDGEHVYAQFGQSQVVCYDLEGNRQWMTAITVPSDKQPSRKQYVNPGNQRQNDSASLLLADDKVIVLMGGSDNEGLTYLQALDKKTGAMLWQTRLDYHRTSHSFPNQTRVKHGDIDAIATSAGAIVRTSDGTIIMKDLPAPIAPPLVVDNEVYLLCGYGQSNGQGSRMKITLNSDGGEIVGTINWACINTDGGSKNPWVAAVEEHAPGLTIGEVNKNDPHSNVGALLIDGMVVTTSGIFDAATGEAKKNFGRFKYEPTGHLIRTGNDLIWAIASGADTPVYDARNLAAPKSYPLGSEWHRRIQLGQMTIEEGAKNVIEFPWLPHSTGHLGGQTTPWPQGNRLYIRRHDTLYCIGDPKADYHSPAATPPAARTGE